MTAVYAVIDRLQQYRPVLERVLFGLGLLGILDVVHLYLQKRQGFEEGCFGVSSLGSAPAGESAFDCATVTSGLGSEFLGVSNIAWGFAFYGAAVALTVLVFWAGPAIRKWVHGGRAGLLAGGWVYSGYLVYLQVGPIDALCALCLVSAGIATALFVVQAATLAQSSTSVESSMPSRLFKRQAAIFGSLLVGALVLVGADLTLFQGSAPASPEATQEASSSAEDPAACRLDPSKGPVGNEGSALISFQDIVKGSSDAPVTIIEYFDPNCPHCKHYHETVKKLQKQFDADEVRFVYKPFPLRASSVPEIQALYIAHQSGKFVEMLEAQYARQGPGGINMADLQSIAEEIGMDPDVLRQRIEQNDYREQILRGRKQAVGVGVDSTPTVLVNGHFVRDRSLECMQTFIKRAKNGTLGGSGSE